MTKSKVPGYVKVGRGVGLVAGIAIFYLFVAPYFPRSNPDTSLARLALAALCGGGGVGAGHFLGSLFARRASLAGGA